MSNNWDVKVAFLTIVTYSGYKALFQEIEKCLKEVGSMKYLKQLYVGLLKSDLEEGNFARRVFEESRELYHPITQGVVESLLDKFT